LFGAGKRPEKIGGEILRRGGGGTDGGTPIAVLSLGRTKAVSSKKKKNARLWGKKERTEG